MSLACTNAVPLQLSYSILTLMFSSRLCYVFLSIVVRICKFASIAEKPDRGGRLALVFARLDHLVSLRSALLYSPGSPPSTFVLDRHLLPSPHPSLPHTPYDTQTMSLLQPVLVGQVRTSFRSRAIVCTEERTIVIRVAHGLEQERPRVP